MRKKILLTILGILVVIQVIRPAKNSSGDRSKDITTQYEVPEYIQTILKESCYDCHSNSSHYPWYSEVQPVGWWLQHHINEGKEHLNFSEFAGYTPKKQAHKMEEVAETVASGEMPMKSYTWMHHVANLSEERKQIIINWAKALQQQITQQGTK